MKNSKNMSKALIGIPVGIFTLELINIIVSICHGTYIRVECLGNNLNLRDIIITYVFCMISSYLLALNIYNSIKTSKKEISILEKAKENNKQSIPIIIILFLISCVSFVINSNGLAILGVLSSFMWAGIVMIVCAFKNILDKHSIKEINNKLKETIKTN